MEPESYSEEKLYQEKKNGIRVIADQMARKYFGYDENGIQISKQQAYDLLLQHKKYETELQNNLNPDNQENKDSTKINQVQEISSNINTNINTKENNPNSIINTHYNTGTNVNTNSNNYVYNENEVTSNLNSKRKETTSLIDKSLNENKIETDSEKDVSIEKMSTEKEDLFNDSFDNINILNINFNQVTKIKKKNIYERYLYDKEMKEKKMKKIKKEEELKIAKELKQYPIIDPYSQEIINRMDYIPINERAAQIHSMKLLKNIIHKQENKIKEYEKEMAEIKKNKLNNKKFDKNNWNKFIKRQKKWNKKVQTKIKAAIILRDNEEEENLFKPKINSRSRSIIEGIEEENKNCIDEVYNRLYNDFDEHRERQKFRNQQSLPSFKPKIIKYSSQKIFGYEPKGPNRCGTNPINYLKKKNKSIKSYILNKSMEQRKQELFIDSCNSFNQYMKNIKRNGRINNKYLKFINKSQQTNQQTNNNISNLNYSQVSSGLINCNYLIVDNQKLNQKGKSKKNSSAPFLPLNIKKMIEKNCKEDEEKISSKEGIGISPQNMDKEKYKFNLSLYNMEEPQEKVINEKYNESEINSLYVGTEKNESKDTDNFYDNLNNNDNSEFKQSQEKEELLAKLEKGKKISPKKNNESLESDKSNITEKNQYKINIRDTTPLFVKENIILASKDYSDFFDIPDFEEEF